MIGDHEAWSRRTGTLRPPTARRSPMRSGRASG